jgi:hypothetical protein
MSSETRVKVSWSTPFTSGHLGFELPNTVLLLQNIPSMYLVQAMIDEINGASFVISCRRKSTMAFLSLGQLIRPPCRAGLGDRKMIILSDAGYEYQGGGLACWAFLEMSLVEAFIMEQILAYMLQVKSLILAIMFASFPGYEETTAWIILIDCAEWLRSCYIVFEIKIIHTSNWWLEAMVLFMSPITKRYKINVHKKVSCKGEHMVPGPFHFIARYLVSSYNHAVSVVVVLAWHVL